VLMGIGYSRPAGLSKGRRLPALADACRLFLN
jgi:hypothetical protein